MLHRRLVEQRAYRKLLTEARVERVDLLGRPGLPGAEACLLGAMRLTTSRPRLGSGEVGFGSESPGQRPRPRRVRRGWGWGVGREQITDGVLGCERGGDADGSEDGLALGCESERGGALK